jgi:Flp pilus assembly protein TadG
VQIPAREMTYVISYQGQFDQSKLMRSHLLSAIRAGWALPAWRSRRGSVAILVAVVLVVLLGFVALGTEVVALLMTSRQMQSAADSAALAAAAARTQGYPTAYANEAVALARDAGFVNGATNPDTTVAVNSPPVSGAYAGNAAAVQVVITQVRPMLLSALSHNAAYTLTASAVGLTGEPGACALALRTFGSPSQTIYVDNNVQTHLNGCGVAANSTSSSAILAKGGADLFASWLNVVGNTSTSGGAVINITGATRTFATAVANPYAARVLPTPQTCFGNNAGVVNFQNVALPPGTYCGNGINIGNFSTVTLSGVYFLKDSNFVVNASTVSGTATIVLGTLGNGSAVGSVTVGNFATLNLTAPGPGMATAGMVFFQDIRAPNTGINDFTNAASVTVNGAVYFPNTELRFDSGSSTASVCTQLIAGKVDLARGNTTISGNCAGYGTLPAGGNPGRLVE